MNLTRISVAALTALTLGLTVSTNAQARPIRVTRGPNGAVHLVNKIPLGATPLSNTATQEFPTLVTRGPNGAAHLAHPGQQQEMPTTMGHLTDSSLDN